MFHQNDRYFDKIECPQLRQGLECKLVNCVFSHTKKRPSEPEPDEGEKRRKVEEPKQDVPKDTNLIIPRTINHVSIPREQRSKNARQIARIVGGSTPNKDALAREFTIAKSSKTLEEYNKKIADYLEEDEKPLVDPKLILPYEVTPAPATIQVRKKNIEALVPILKQLDAELKTPVLEALKIEHQVASTTSSHTYMHTFRTKIYEIKNPDKFKPLTKELTDKDYYNKLLEYVIPENTLSKYGYIMEIPKQVAPATKRTCKRCGVQFEMKDQLTPVTCTYHSGKTFKRDKERVWDCCGGVIGENETQPCTTHNHHVFYWSNPEEMHAAQPFRITKEMFSKKPGALKAVGIDCEMGFTTLGFELLRITAIDFFTGEEAIDLLVKPKGVVIDLNTRWSGIAEIKDEALSFEQSMELMGEVIDQDTILIGHGLENDMNAMRMIHSKIVDTAVLFPRNKTTPTFRYALKYLTFRYLGRTIQTGEHDSGEDSLAAIDIVKYFIKQDLNTLPT